MRVVAWQPHPVGIAKGEVAMMGGDLRTELEFGSESERWARWDQMHEEILRLAHQLMEAREDAVETHSLVSRLEQLLEEAERLRQCSA